MKHLKLVTNDDYQYYLEGDLGLERMEYDKGTGIISLVGSPFEDGIPFSGTGVYFYVRNYSTYDPFVTKPELGEWQSPYYPVEFYTPDGQLFSGYYGYNQLYTGATTSSLTTVGYAYKYDITGSTKYCEYQYLPSTGSNEYEGFYYYDFSSICTAPFLDGDGLYGCNRWGNLLNFNSDMYGRWVIGEEVQAYKYSSGYILTTARLITRPYDGEVMYYADIKDEGVPQICYSGNTINNLPLLFTDYYYLHEQHVNIENVYEDEAFPGVTYNKDNRTVFYNNPNKRLYFIDPNPSGGNRTISSTTLNDLGITVETLEGYLEALQAGYPTEWFNIRINNNNFTYANFKDDVLNFKRSNYIVAFDLENETCVFEYYQPGPA